MDRGRDRRVAVTEDADGNPVREVQVGLTVRIVEVVALAARPRSLEVATEDRRQVGCGQGGQVEPRGAGKSCGRGGHGVHGWVLGYVAGRAASLGRAAADLGRVYLGRVGPRAARRPRAVRRTRAATSDRAARPALRATMAREAAHALRGVP